MPFGYFTKPRVKCVVVADSQERGEGVGRCVRRCRAICGGARRRGGAGNVNKIEWWVVVFDIVGFVSAREGWVGKNGESMRQTE